jgi:hypothetical protein
MPWEGHPGESWIMKGDLSHSATEASEPPWPRLAMGVCALKACRRRSTAVRAGFSACVALHVDAQIHTWGLAGEEPSRI